jgi:pilus assembly protein CpaE
VLPYDAKLAAQSAKLGKPMAEVASGKMSGPFNQLATMVLSHATEEGAGGDAGKSAGSAKSLVDNLKSMLSKPNKQAKAA